MALAAKLLQRQTQSLVMTPQLLQSIRLLQLSHAELERFVEEEAARNPLLEVCERHEEADEQPEALTGDRGGGEQEWPRGMSAEAMAERLDSSLENLFPDDPGRAEPLAPEWQAQWKSAALYCAPAEGEGFSPESLAAPQPTLREHLARQIALAFTDPGERAAALELADMLDEAGYLRADLAELAERLGLSRPAVEAVLRTCQSFEPAGLFARDLAECLALQLAARDRLDPAMAALLAHLELLARRDFAALRRICGVGEEDLLDMLAEIRRLDPKPGTAFTAGIAEPVIPDVIVRPAADGSWSVELNPAALPRVLVNESYYAEVSAGTKAAAERRFLAECLQNAHWLARSLDQRARTILKVASEIVRQQDGFLVHGVRHLRPLNLKTVAEAIGMHESTVSRVTANKFMVTPRGLFELRYFFSGAIASAAGGEAHSSQAVRDRIRSLIEAEPPDAVLSDDALVETLRKEGIGIARRTVAKYREGMNIPSSVERRREKRAFMKAAHHPEMCSPLD
jgi:RNA polymerase sigma-54 factor